VLPPSVVAEGSSLLAGVASVASTAAAWMVGPLLAFLSSMKVDGLTGLLMISSSGLLVMSLLGETAYQIAEDVSPRFKNKMSGLIFIGE